MDPLKLASDSKASQAATPALDERILNLGPVNVNRQMPVTQQINAALAQIPVPQAPPPMGGIAPPTNVYKPPATPMIFDQWTGSLTTFPTGTNPPPGGAAVTGPPPGTTFY